MIALYALKVMSVGALILAGCLIALLGSFAFQLIAMGGWAWLGMIPLAGFCLLYIGLGALLLGVLFDDRQ